MGRNEAHLGDNRLCVIYASEDAAIARKLVEALERRGWDAWSAEELGHGDWARRVRTEIDSARALVPLLSKYSRDKPIFADEWELAQSLGKPIFPFALDDSGAPLGMGRYNRTVSLGWNGDLDAPGFLELAEKLRANLAPELARVRRPREISLGKKTLAVPSFVFSLSSFETQLDPTDGLELLVQLRAPACLVSAYDAKPHMGQSRNSRFWRGLDSLCGADTVVFLDSGNYEAARKSHDYKSRTNINGWSHRGFWEVACAADADIVFTYDKLPSTLQSTGGALQAVLDQYEQDMFNTGLGPDVLCPIIHLTNMARDPAAGADLIAEVARNVRPQFVAVPERELGDGILARMRAVKMIRARLNDLGFYQPLHILGTGNPTTIAALAVCGADSFDGLEWCRTAANYDSHNLLHFQQFDLLSAAFAGRMTTASARAVVELKTAPFALRAASYNMDYFCDWLRIIRSMIHSEQQDNLLRYIPSVGTLLVEGAR